MYSNIFIYFILIEESPVISEIHRGLTKAHWS